MTTDQPAQAPVDVREGDILAGKYRIEKILGAGGMGVVVAAHHLHLDEKVAIKFLVKEALGNAEAVARFSREARAAVKIKSEHVVRVSDVGTLDNGAPYMVMEYLEGGDLGEWLRLYGVLPVELAVEFVLQACEAVAHAHSLGIVHRDLKPANLFCTRSPDGLLSVKVLDFGISKVGGTARSGSDMALTRTNAVLGSPSYMSPEQLLSSTNVDARTDLWGLGVVLYELLTGALPFQGTSLPEVYAKISSQPPTPIRELRHDVPPEVEAIIFKCLHKDRNQRYPTVAELAVALLPFGPKRSRASAERISRIMRMAGLSDSDPSLPPTLAAPGAGPASLAAWGQTQARSVWTPRRLTALAAVGGCAVLAAVGWIGWKHLGPNGATVVPGIASGAPEVSLQAIALLPSGDARTPPTPSALASANAPVSSALQKPAPVASRSPHPVSTRPPRPARPINLQRAPAADPFAQPH